MAISYRSYSAPTDITAMLALARRFASGQQHSCDLPYRLSSWAFDDTANAALWFTETQELVAWAVLQSPWWTIDIVCHPDWEAHLSAEILEWADRRAHHALPGPFGHPSWFNMVFPEQTDRIAALENAGYRCQADVGENSWSQVLLQRPGALAIKRYSPPPGFQARSLAGNNEVEAYVELHQSVFESKNMTLNWRARTLRQPDYRPELDVVVEAPDGRLGAFCIGWLDPVSGAGQIEPLGCHKDFRRYALGRVALAETLQRLQALGADPIIVETDNYRDTAFQLYESMGFEVIREIHVYRKDFATQ
jgi:ribosomal protein S18 acetylase RimI-like enzyme